MNNPPGMFTQDKYHPNLPQVSEVSTQKDEASRAEEHYQYSRKHDKCHHHRRQYRALKPPSRSNDQ